MINPQKLTFPEKIAKFNALAKEFEVLRDKLHAPFSVLGISLAHSAISGFFDIESFFTQVGKAIKEALKPVLQEYTEFGLNIMALMVLPVLLVSRRALFNGSQKLLASFFPSGLINMGLLNAKVNTDELRDKLIKAEKLDEAIIELRRVNKSFSLILSRAHYVVYAISTILPHLLYTQVRHTKIENGASLTKIAVSESEYGLSMTMFGLALNHSPKVPLSPPYNIIANASTHLQAAWNTSWLIKKFRNWGLLKSVKLFEAGISKLTLLDSSSIKVKWAHPTVDVDLPGVLALQFASKRKPAKIEVGEKNVLTVSQKIYFQELHRELLKNGLSAFLVGNMLLVTYQATTPKKLNTMLDSFKDSLLKFEKQSLQRENCLEKLNNILPGAYKRIYSDSKWIAIANDADGFNFYLDLSRVPDSITHGFIRIFRGDACFRLRNESIIQRKPSSTLSDEDLLKLNTQLTTAYNNLTSKSTQDGPFYTLTKRQRSKNPRKPTLTEDVVLEKKSKVASPTKPIYFPGGYFYRPLKPGEPIPDKYAFPVRTKWLPRHFCAITPEAKDSALSSKIFKKDSMLYNPMHKGVVRSHTAGKKNKRGAVGIQTTPKAFTDLQGKQHTERTHFKLKFPNQLRIFGSKTANVKTSSGDAHLILFSAPKMKKGRRRLT